MGFLQSDTTYAFKSKSDPIWNCQIRIQVYLSFDREFQSKEFFYAINFSMNKIKWTTYLLLIFVFVMDN